MRSSVGAVVPSIHGEQAHRVVLVAEGSLLVSSTVQRLRSRCELTAAPGVPTIRKSTSGMLWLPPSLDDQSTVRGATATIDPTKDRRIDWFHANREQLTG